MTLPLETAAVGDQYAKRALDILAQRFPLAPPDLLGAIPTTTATLPTGKYSGQDFYYQLSGGGVWHFKYNVTSAKWDFAGGPPMTAAVNTQESTVSAAFADLATAGPDVTVPFAGDYNVEVRGGVQTPAAQSAYMSYAVGGTAASDTDSAYMLGGAGSAVEGAVISPLRQKTGLAASTLLRAKYRVTGGTGFFQRRCIVVYPIRVS